MHTDVLEKLRGPLSRQPDALHEYAVELVGRLTRSSIGLYCRLGLVDDRPLPVRWVVRGTDEQVVRRQLEERIVFPGSDLRLPDERWNRRFVTLRQLMDPERELLPTRLYRRCLEPAGVHDLVRMIVCHEGRFVAWIGAMRGPGEPPFSRADVRRIAPVADALATALIAAERTEHATSSIDGCDLVVRTDGSVDMASRDAQALLARPSTSIELRAFARAMRRGAAPGVIAGHRARWSRLRGANGDRYLVHLEPIEALALHPAWVLSPTQREVGRFAAAGATVEEIARVMGIAPATVRTHLRQIYARLEIASRAELARMLVTIPDDDEGTRAA